MIRVQMESLQDQLRGYAYALPFIGICALAGYYYGRVQFEAVKGQCEA